MCPVFLIVALFMLVFLPHKGGHKANCSFRHSSLYLTLVVKHLQYRGAITFVDSRFLGTDCFGHFLSISLFTRVHVCVEENATWYMHSLWGLSDVATDGIDLGSYSTSSRAVASAETLSPSVVFLLFFPSGLESQNNGE